MLYEVITKAIERGSLTAEQYNDFNSKLISLQSQVEEADKQFSSHFDQKSETLIMDTLFAQKESMMKEILELNNVITSYSIHYTKLYD